MKQTKESFFEKLRARWKTHPPEAATEATIVPGIFLFQTVHQVDDRAQVWFETQRELPAATGDWVTLRARVFEVRRGGGYRRTGEADPVSQREGFTLDIAEIFLVGIGERP